MHGHAHARTRTHTRTHTHTHTAYLHTPALLQDAVSRIEEQLAAFKRATEVAQLDAAAVRSQLEHLVVSEDSARLEVGWGGGVGVGVGVCGGGGSGRGRAAVTCCVPRCRGERQRPRARGARREVRE